MTPAIYQENLNEMVDAIVKTGLAQKIIVFGSYARNELAPDSDIDICVLTNDLSRPKIEVTYDIRHAISRLQKVPVDVLVFQPQLFIERANAINSIEKEIYTKGVTVYEQ